MCDNLTYIYITKNSSEFEKLIKNLQITCFINTKNRS